MIKPPFINAWETFVQVRHSALIFYRLPCQNHHSRKVQFTKPTYTGKSTTGQTKRIRRAVDLLLQISKPITIMNQITHTPEKHTLSFITLTISGKERKLTSKEGNKLLLAPWLLQMRRKSGMTTYIWKAEFQKNGQLHYHITTPTWIHYQVIKDSWNNILSANGFLTQYHIEHPGKMPNSTDVHKVYKIKNLQAYLIKYLSKVDQDGKNEGKIWDCSINLKENKLFSTIETNQLHKNLNGKSITYFERCGIINLDKPSDYLPKTMLETYEKFLKHIQTYKRK